MPAEALPARIGRYEIVAELARGSMGRVFRARDPNIDREVALKVLAPLHLAGAEGEEEELRQRFLLEARAAGRLNHPGIVMVLDADSDPATGSPYIAMELVEGRSLESALRERGRLPPGWVVEVAARVARALAYAHGQGVIHRDVKPSNILISNRGAVKVSDFGIAKLASQSLTVTGYVLGSPFFMSPEQVRGEPVDGRTDLFSLGSVLYRALTGAFPFGGDSIAAVTFKVVHAEPQPATSLLPEIPPSLAALIERALAKDPARRFQEGGEMATALEGVAKELRGGSPAVALAVSPVVAAGEGGGPPEVLEEGLETGTVIRVGPPPPTPHLPPGREVERPAWPATARRVALPAAAAAAVLLGVLAVVFAIKDEGSRAGEAGPEAESTSATGEAEPGAEGTAATGEAGLPAEGSPPGSLHIVYNNRLASGTMSAWVDGQRVWSGDVSGPRSVIKRVAGREVRHTLQVPPGDHTVEVRISGRTVKIRVDAADRIRGRFEAHRARWLRVTLNPVTNRLKLSWME